MYKKILCATDFSEISFEAVRAASALAKALQAELILLHVVAPMASLPNIPAASPSGWPQYELTTFETAWKEAAGPQLKKIADTMVDPSVRTRSLILSGQPAQTIDQCAADEKADLIVIATHGMTGLQHYLMGSVAQKVIQHSPLPVLVVRGSKGS